ncbi:MAG: copper homeostasis protein CutC [Prevotella sp.]|nr:copper homeostasis protein CutC [Prevotella sp.]
MKHILEVCCGNLESVAAAVEGGARRIELCMALSVDGLTPSIGMLQTIRKRYPGLTIHVLIRPREGDFVYSQAELQAMLGDITQLAPFADGFVAGALTNTGDIDVAATQLMVRAAGSKSFTFHRAFDACRNPIVALEQLISIGCNRLLTSGQAVTAEQGIDMIRRLCDLAGERLVIMPGGGVRASNAWKILKQTGAYEIHGSCSHLHNGIAITEADEVQRVLAAINGHGAG